MASPKRINYSPEAIDELDEIWRWNAARYSAAHADNHLAILRSRIDGLERVSSVGKLVSIRTNLRYILILQRGARHGHIAVYQVGDDTVEVLHIFHTAQDWQGMLSSEEP